MKRSHAARAAALLLVFAGSPLAIAGSPITESEIITPTGISINDEVGWSAAMDGTTLALGAPKHNVTGADNGAVFFFDEAGNQQKISASSPGIFDYFGYSVDMSDDLLMVGAPNGPISTREGSAFIFRRQADGSWLEEVELVAYNGQSFDYYGCAVAISDTTAVVGAFLSDEYGSSAGAVYVYTYDGTDWNYKQQLIADEATLKFGASVAIADDRILVGSPRDNINGTSAGGAYVFGLDESDNWEQEMRLVPDDIAAYDYFGYAVDLDDDGEQAVIGAIFDDSAGPNAGAAYVFEIDEDEWVQVEQLVPSGAEPWQKFGSSVSIDGDKAAIGAYGYPDSAGHGYLYEATAGGWVEVVKLESTDGDNGARVGYAAAMSDMTALLSAPWQNDKHGAGYVYDFTRSLTPGDANIDGNVDILDILVVLSKWGDCPIRPAPCDGDINRSDSVEVLDLLAVLAAMK